MWKWCQQRNIHISAVYVPGQLNLIADMSRLINLNSDWKLNPAIFRQICVIYTTPDPDLLETRTNNQLHRFISLFPGPDALATNAFTVPWSNQLCYAFPPYGQIMNCLKNSVRQSQGSPCCSSVEVETMVFNSLVDGLLSPIVASQYPRPSDSTITMTSRENAPETGTVSRTAAGRRCFSQVLRWCPTSSCPCGGHGLRHRIKVE